jgi:hypothetical protein
MHSKGTIIVMTAATLLDAKIDTTSPPTPAGIERANYWHLAFAEQPKDYESYARQKYAFKPLHKFVFPDLNNAASIDQFWTESKNSASTWFIYPNEMKPKWLNGKYYLETPKMWIAVIPLNGNAGFDVSLSKSTVYEMKNEEAKKFFADYNLISFAGEVSGYVLEAAEKSQFETLATFDTYIQKTTILTSSEQAKNLHYKSVYGDKMEMRYQSNKLRPVTKLNGKNIDFDSFTMGAVYQSPYINVKNGLMKVSDGASSFTVDFRGELPVYK